MPIYEYHCDKCGSDFEELVSRSEEHTVKCGCGSARVQRVLSAFAVGGSGDSASVEPGPCGACGAPERGSCQN
jgi:putative FmdB family regulatory protein